MQENKKLAEVEKVLDGIDKDETEYQDGWWETSVGAKFGAQKLKEIRSILNRPSPLMSVRLSDFLLLLIACTWADLHSQPLAYLLVPITIAGWFFNPRWSKSTGWRFKHDQ